MAFCHIYIPRQKINMDERRKVPLPIRTYY
jgi:hypothetical protein